MKVYEVTSTWVNYDGWPVSGPHTKGTFLDEQKARDFMFRETGQQSAKDYGYATVGHDRWGIRTIEVTE